MLDNSSGAGVGFVATLTLTDIALRHTPLSQIPGGDLNIVQTVIQGGAIALLAWWIIVDRPKERKELRDERDTVAKERANERAQFSAVVSKLIEEFRGECRENRQFYADQLRQQREECDKHLESILSRLQSQVKPAETVPKNNKRTRDYGEDN